MKKNSLILIVISFLTGCISKENVELIIHNGKIYSLDINEKIYEALAIQNGKIISIGKNNQILNKYQSNKKIDLKGSVVYPGFIDSHCHLLSYGLQNQQVDLTSCQSFDEVISKLKNLLMKMTQNGLLEMVGIKINGLQKNGLLTNN